VTAGERSAATRSTATLARALLMLYPPAVRRDVGAAVIADVRRRARELCGRDLVAARVYLPMKNASAPVRALRSESPRPTAALSHGSFRRWRPRSAPRVAACGSSRRRR